LALARAALLITSTELTILDACNRAGKILWHAADIPSTSHGNLVADEWIVAVIVIRAGDAIKPLHLVKALSTISVVEAISTDKARIAMRIVCTLRAKLTLRFGAFGGAQIAEAGEARVVVVAAISNDFLPSAFAHLRVAVPFLRWADVELVGTTCHIHDILSHRILLLAEENFIYHSFYVDTQGDVVVLVVVEDL
jgi:hypothetical protein